MKKIIYFLFVCVGAFYACKDEEQVLLNADFISDKQTISAGEKVYFMDKSAGEPVRWDWAFEGGEPSVSNLFSPEIVYNYPGTYTVKLSASVTERKSAFAARDKGQNAST